MAIPDLSYAKKKDNEKPAILAIETRGWMVGWALAVENQPGDCGRLAARDHIDGKPVPASQRVAGVFRGLLNLALEHHVDLIVSEHKSKPGPLWAIPPILAAALQARYGELSDWMAELGMDSKQLRSWATVVLGKPPEDEILSAALGMAAAASRVRHREPDLLRPPGVEL